MATLGLIFAGLALNIACLVLTLKRYRRSPALGIIGSILFFPAMIADQTGQFSNLSPPTGIIYVEIVEAIVAVSIIVLGTLLLQEKAPSGLSPGRREVRAVLTIALLPVTTALVFLSTAVFQFPIGATGGYFNFGDIMIFIIALTFGPEVGGFSGGVGSWLSDFLGGYGTFAPFTLVIKGSEGFIVGLISRRGFRGRDIVGWIGGSVAMVGGYFLAESYVIAALFGASDLTGIVAATGEVPFNLLQVVAGGVVGIPISWVLRRSLRETPLSFILSKTKMRE